MLGKDERLPPRVFACVTCLVVGLRVLPRVLQVSLVGVLFLAGLYISSVSSSMGGLYGSPRILQCIANENVIPIMKVLGQGVRC